MSGNGRTTLRIATETGTHLVTLLAVALALVLAPAAAHGQAATITLGREPVVDLIPPGTITANGTDQRLVFVITDEMGGLAEDVRFRGSSVSAGRLSEWESFAPGLWTCLYTPPDSSQVRQATLKVKAKVGTKATEREFELDLAPSVYARFAFESSPAQVVLNQHPNASLRFTASGPDGGPLDDLDLLVSASAGTVQNVRGIGGGKYEALFVPPPNEIAPKVAIISVVDADHPETAVGFFTIPLVGNIPWQVNAQVANASVTMDVAGTRFGPFLTDETGNAFVPILVPPGVSTATATVVDTAGNSSGPQTVDLMVPPFKRVKIAPLTSYMPGDGAFQRPVYLNAIDLTGNGDPSATIEITPSHGEASAVTSLGDGLYQAVYTAPLVDQPTAVTLTAAIPGSQMDVEVVSFEVVPPLPMTLSLLSDPAGVAAGDASVALTGTVEPVEGGTTDYCGVNFLTNAGLMQQITTEGEGVFQADYEGNFDARTVITAMATVPAVNRPPETIVAFAVDDQVATNQHTVIVAMAVDRYGLPVAGVPLRAEVLKGGGSVSGDGTTDATGRVFFTFKAAPLASLSLVEITGGGMTFTAPLWQTQSYIEGFAIPPSGGATQKRMLTTWEPLLGRLHLGGEGRAVAAPSVGAPVVTPVVGSGPANPWASAAEEPAPVEPPPAELPAVEPTPLEAPAVEPPPEEPAPEEPPPSEPAPEEPAETPAVEPEPAAVEPPPEEPTSEPAAGPPTRIEITATPNTLPRDGTSTSDVLVRVLDAAGRLVPGEQVVMVTTAGVLSNKEDNGDGTFSAVLIAPKAGSDVQANISASHLQGEMSAFTSVLLTTPVIAKPERTPKVRTPAPPTSNKYRTARLMLRYPLGGYTYDMQPEPCSEDMPAEIPCDFFRDIHVAGPEGSGGVGLFESIGVEGEVFPIQYVGATVRVERYGYRTDYSVTTESGENSVFRDGMYHVIVSATGRVPLLKDRTVGPLDIMVHLGYHAHDVVVFKKHGRESGVWTWQNLWLNGFRIGVTARFQIVPFAQVHAGWAGTLISTGLSANEVAFGCTFRVWKGLTLDARYQFLGRELRVTNGEADESPTYQEAHIGETSNALVLGVGWSF